MKFENKYKPTKLSEFKFPDVATEMQVQQYISNQMDGHLLLHGTFGSGKTTLANLLPLEIARIKDPDVETVWFESKAGHEISIEVLKQLRMSAGLVQLQLPKQLIVIDEADRMTAAAMQAMKKVIDDTEPYCSFVFCTNHLDKMEGGIVSRCVKLPFVRTDITAMTQHAKSILTQEGVPLPDDKVDRLVEQARGDYRKLLQTLENVCFRLQNKKAA